MHEVLVNRLGGLSLPRKSVVRLTDCPDMTLDVYHGRKTIMQQQQQPKFLVFVCLIALRFCIITALIAEQFLERTASQLTYHGLCELNTQVKDDELAVFFRNNHFTTLYRNKVSTLMCLSIGTPKNNKFSICSKWKIYYFKVSQN